MEMILQPRGGNHYLDTEPARATLAMALFLPLIATLGVAARLYVRFERGLTLAMDDWLSIFALIFHYCQIAGVFVYIFLGYFGHHIWELSPAQLLVDLKLSTFTQYPYGLSLGLARSSIIALLVRIFFVRPFKIAAYSVLSLNVFWMIFVIIVTSTHCLPFRYNWDKKVSEGHCISQNSYLVSIAAWGLVTDTAITILPFPMIWNLQLTLRRKIELSIIFGFWVLDIFISIFRIITVLQLDESDLPYSGVSTALWAVAEPSVAILVSCLPVYRTLLDKIYPKIVISRLKSKMSRTKRSRHTSQGPRLLEGGVGRQLGHGSIGHGSSRHGVPQLEELELQTDISHPFVYVNHDEID